MLVPGNGKNAVAPETADPFLIGELKSIYAEEGFSGETRRNRFRSLYKSQRRRMSTEKRFNRRRSCGCRSACRNGSQHLQKFFGGAHRKAVMRMSDNIRVDMVSKMKTNGNASRACALRMI